MTVPPTMRTDPSQSMALRPANRAVLGVSISRKNNMITNARASKGTMSNILAKEC